MTRLLPFAVAVAVPAVVFGTVYAMQGQHPAWGLVAGAIGLMGALSAEIVHLLSGRREVERAEREHWQAVQRSRNVNEQVPSVSAMQEELTRLRRELHPPTEEERRQMREVHDGLKRLHDDVARDEATRKYRPPER